MPPPTRRCVPSPEGSRRGDFPASGAHNAKGDRPASQGVAVPTFCFPGGAVWQCVLQQYFIPPGRVYPTDSVPLDGMRLVGGGLHSARVVFSLSPSLACGGALGLGVGPGVRSVHQHEQTVCKGRAGLQGTDKFLGWSRAQFFINHPSKLAGCLAMGRNDSSSALPKVPGRRKGRAEGPVDLGPKPLSTNLPVTLGRIILSG